MDGTVFDSIFEPADAARAIAGLDDTCGPWWATLDAASWQPLVEGTGPARGATRIMLVAASVAHGEGLGRLWHEAAEDRDDMRPVVRTPDGILLTPRGQGSAPAPPAREAGRIVRSLTASTTANLTWTAADRPSFDCHRRHQVCVPTNGSWGSDARDLAALLVALAAELTMRRGSPLNPPELVGSLAAAFAFAQAGFDPASARRAKVRIERPSCLPPRDWRPEVTDDPGLLLQAADEAQLVAEELLSPVTGGDGRVGDPTGVGGKGKAEGDDSGNGEGGGARETDASRPACGTYMLGDVAATARAATRALARHRHHRRPW